VAASHILTMFSRLSSLPSATFDALSSKQHKSNLQGSNNKIEGSQEETKRS
jgi:hypothetical protein